MATPSPMRVGLVTDIFAEEKLFPVALCNVQFVGTVVGHSWITSWCARHSTPRSMVWSHDPLVIREQTKVALL